jgi:hypothetical protein
MSLVNFTNLDFDQIKTTIKDFLRSNSDFTDYDFEGSNLSVIIDTLAYNTYIASYNANMVSNEVFIDSATLRENVVSLARNIGYVPRSRTSARANISFFVDTTGLPYNPLSVTLQKGLVCTSSSFGNQNYAFSILDDITVPVVNGIAIFDSIEVYEGNYTKNTFTVNSFNPNQRYVLNNTNIDTSTLKVSVRDTESSNKSLKYINSSSILDVNSQSKVYFIQEVADQRYELIFGDGVIGKKLESGNVIDASYIVSNGKSGNGFNSFNFSGIIIDSRSNKVLNGISLITVDQNSKGGKEIESVASIKNFAPRLYAAQNRAVTSSDYESIVPLIYPETQSVNVFGGEDLDPPQFGKVFITIKPSVGTFLSNTVKDNIKNGLKKYSVAGIIPEILDAKVLYIETTSNVYYNQNLSTSANDVKTQIISNINSFANSEEINKYGARFKYSKYQNIIDNSDQSITSNITKVQMRRDLKVLQNKLVEYEICFGNQFYIKDDEGYNIKSSSFNIAGVQRPVYISDRPNSDLKTGSIFLFYLDSKSQPVMVSDGVGTIDYVKGEIRTFPIKIISTTVNSGGTPVIEISAIPKSNDIIGLQDIYLQLDTNRVEVAMLPDNIESGSDSSGSNYIFTSSYFNGDLVRN